LNFEAVSFGVEEISL